MQYLSYITRDSMQYLSCITRVEYAIPELHNLSIECKDMENNMQHRCLFVILFDIIRFVQASLAAGGTVQISLLREYWAVYISLTGTNG